MKHWTMTLTMGLLLIAVGCKEVESEGDDTTSTAGTGTGDNDTQEATDSSPDSGTDSSSAKDCSDLSVDACAQRQDCRVIDGRKVFEDEKCLMGSEPLGCMPMDVDCGDALTPSKDPSGECYWFTSTCIPDGWESLLGTSECEVGDYRLCDCEEYSATSCDESNGCKRIYGRRGIIEEQCLLDSEAIGCMSADQGCDDGTTFAIDPAGGCYLTNGCIPKGWNAPDATSKCKLDFFPDTKSCDPNKVACLELTAKECSLRPECRVISGRRVDTNKQCLFDYEVVGCMAADMGCTDDECLAIGPDGDCYWFSNGCLPSGWTGADIFDDPACNHDAVGDLTSCN